MSFVYNGKKVKNLLLPEFGTGLRAEIYIDEQEYEFMQSQVDIIAEKTINRILKEVFKE